MKVLKIYFVELSL